jgi:hypothetical protein
MSMDYNENLVQHIERFERAANKASLPEEMKRKLGSLIGCLEYQVEEGDWPDEVIVHLQSAMRAWLESSPQGRDLIPKLDHCIDSIH